MSSSEASLPALIPAAGRGTRLRPMTRYLSKAMFPVGNRPVIEYAFREAHRAGCRPIVVIASPDDRALERYVRDAGGDRPLTLVHQAEPRGLADALWRGYRCLDGPEQCAFLLPDNVVWQGNAIRRIRDCSLPKRDLQFGTVRVSPEEAPYFGESGRYVSGPAPEREDGVEKIVSLQRKGDQSFADAPEGEGFRRTVARGLLPRAFFEKARERDPDPETGEVDDVPIYREMIGSTPAWGVPVRASVFDMGTPARYLRLCAHAFGDPGGDVPVEQA